MGKTLLAIGAIASINMVGAITPEDIGAIGKVLIEIAVGIVYLISIFRKKKE